MGRPLANEAGEASSSPAFIISRPGTGPCSSLLAVKRVLRIVLFLATTACAPAQTVRVTEGPPADINPALPTLIGVSIQELGGDCAWNVKERLLDAFRSAGFQAMSDLELRAGERTEVRLKVTATQFVSADGTHDERLRSARVTVHDLRDGHTILTIDVPKASWALAAPKLNDFAQQVVDEMHKPDQPAP